MWGFRCQLSHEQRLFLGCLLSGSAMSESRVAWNELSRWLVQ